MTGTRGKRGVARELKALIAELAQLEKELRTDPNRDAEQASALVLNRFPWDVLDARRRARQDLALGSATEEMTRILSNIEVAKAARGKDRSRAVREALQKLFARPEDLFDLLEPVLQALAWGGLKVGTNSRCGAAVRKRLSGNSMMAFFMVFSDQLLDEKELIADLAAGQGPKESVCRLLARVTGVGRTTIRAAALSK